MAKQRVHNQKSLKKLLQEHGWEADIGGKHSVKMIKAGERPITLPKHKGRDYGPRLTKAILNQAALS